MFTKKYSIKLISFLFLFSAYAWPVDLFKDFSKIPAENLKEYHKYKKAGDHEKELATILKIYPHIKNSNNQKSVLEYLSRATELAARYQNRKYRIEFLKVTGLTYYRQGNFTEAENSFGKILEIAESANDQTLAAQMSSNLGAIMEIQGKYDGAIKKYMKAQKIFEAKKQYAFSAKVLHNIGVLYTEIKDASQAVDYFTKALDMKRKYSGNKEIAATLNGLGTVYEGSIKDFDKALYYYTQALELYKKEKDIKHITKILGNIGLVHFQLKDYKKAAEYYDLAMNNIAQHKVTASYRPSIYFNRAMLYLRTGEHRKAVSDFKESIKYCNKYKRINKSLDSHLYLSETYKKLGKFKEAFETLEQHNKIREKLYNENIHKQISTLQKKFETEKKNQQIKLLSQENEINSNKLKFVVALVLLLITLILLLVWINRLRKKQNIIREDDLKQKLLKAQMNPHFLFNALSTIQFLIKKGETDRGYKYLGKFASLTRSILENSEKDFITLEEEIAMLRSYLDIESLCRQGSFDYFIDVDSDIETEMIMIPPMLIQPFAENAIKHAFKNCESGNHIELTFTETSDNHINIRISDNGSGISPKSSGNDTKKKSLGMDIFRKRVTLFEKRYKCKVDHTVRNLNGIEGTGTEIAIKLPIIGE